MPLPLTVSCFSKIQIGFTFLVLAHLGSPGKGPLNECACVSAYIVAEHRLVTDVAWSVCLSLSDRASRDAVWAVDLGGPKEQYIRWGARCLHSWSTFRGLRFVEKHCLKHRMFVCLRVGQVTTALLVWTEDIIRSLFMYCCCCCCFR